MARKNTITSVITGDMIRSREIKSTSRWLTDLKKVLSREGVSPQVWEIYRGDSFQVEIKDPSLAFLRAIQIKATIRCIENLDVRMAIGIGEKEYVASKITQSNGTAFVNSGEKLESLKKEKQNLAVKTPSPEFDKDMNLYIRLALIAMDNWTQSSAVLIKELINNPDITQKQLAKKLKIAQSSVSERMKRSSYSEIMDVEALYREKINKMILSK